MSEQGVLVALTLLLAVSIGVIAYLITCIRVDPFIIHMVEYEKDAVASLHVRGIPRNVDRKEIAKWCPCAECARHSFSQMGCLKRDWNPFEDIELMKRPEFLRIAYYRMSK